MTGVGVYRDSFSTTTSTSCAANTSSAVANAGAESACVSRPRKSGPEMPSRRRYSTIAAHTATMCRSLNVRFSEEPRWPDVPNATRSRAAAGSG
jgi:hypothetical protein